MKYLSAITLLFLVNLLAVGQNAFGLKDSLRGSLRPERNYDVSFYDLDVTVDISNQSLKGVCEIHLTANQALSVLQIDLYEKMNIRKITEGGRELKFQRTYDAILVQTNLKKGENAVFKCFYDGKPQTAKHAPWDGGFVWAKDQNNKPWVGVACEGAGASLWWPNKDHLSDEPEKGMEIHITVPSELMAISNGNLSKVTETDKTHKT